MVINAYNEKGLPLTDVNGEHQLGAMQVQTTSQDGVRVSVNNGFIQPIRYKRKNLTVKVKSEVIKILIDDKKTAYGVQYVRDGKVLKAFAKKEVIVSGGSINSPKLLMLSGIGPEEHLSKLNIRVKKDLAVGENLHDHVTFNGYVIALSNKTSTRIENEEMLDEIYEYSRMKYKNGPISHNGLVNSIAFLKSDPSLPAPDVQIHVDNVFPKEFVYEPVATDSITTLPTAYYDGIIPRIMSLTPKSRGKLLLNPRNPNGPPLLYAGYFANPADLIPIVKVVRFYLTLENTKAFKSLGARFVRKPLPACNHYEWGTDEYTVCLARAYTSSPFHPVGTCKMGPREDVKAVVDPRLRVYGISHLRVIDASIMPFVVRGNTNAPSIMIGERGVDFVIEDWAKHYY